MTRQVSAKMALLPSFLLDLSCFFATILGKLLAFWQNGHFAHTEIFRKPPKTLSFRGGRAA